MSQQPDKFDGTSASITEEQKAKLKALFPEVITEGGKVDFDKLKLTLGESVDAGKERYGMNWPGKADCFKTIQKPSMATLVPARDESVNFDTTENLIIEGDNLEVLKLLQKAYIGKVKMIYIDPPYNTGNDFIYPDDYSESLETYLRYTGQVDNEGRKFSTNTDTDGRFHSKWMNMIYPRLFLAKNLLRDDGVIFISIDDNEVNNLRRICDEIFGEENLVSQITVQNNPRGRQSDTFVATVHEYLLVYSKNFENCVIGGASLSEDQRAEFEFKDENGKAYRLLGLRQRGAASLREDRPEMFFPIYVNPKTLRVSLDRDEFFSVEVLPRKSDGRDGRWMWGKEKTRRDSKLIVARLIERRGEYDIFVYDYLEREGKERERKFKTIWDDKSFNTQNGTQEVKSLLDSDAMSFPKPMEFIKTIVQMGTVEDDVVLDFFAGSGTTAHAVLELNEQDKGKRNFILVQLPEPTSRKDFVTVAEITKERVRKVIKKLNDNKTNELGLPNKSKQDLGFKVFKLQSSNFKAWNAEQVKDEAALTEQLSLHVDHLVAGRSQEDVLYELLLKSGFPLDTKIEKLSLANKTVFSIGDGLMLVCLEHDLTLEVLRAMADKKPERVVCLDAGFANNDQLKTNAVQTMKAKEVKKFQTV
jgi:adenine-specific DNA-methyltransferase